MHAVPKLVRQRHHVARLAMIVQQEIRMHARDRRMREGAARLARRQARIDPRLVEEATAHRGQFRAERAVRIQHLLRRIGPFDPPVVVVGQRRVAVPVLQLRQPEPLRLHLVVAMRQARVRLAHRGHQRFDDLVLHHVGAIAEAAWAWVVAPGVLDLLVLGQGVGDQREQPDVVAERFPNRLAGGFPDSTVTVGQLVQRGADRQFLAVQLDPHGGDRLIEQPRPRPLAVRSRSCVSSPGRRRAGADGTPADRAARAGSGPGRGRPAWPPAPRRPAGSVPA